MTDLAPPHGLASPLDVHNRVLRAADARLDDLVEQLAGLLEPILERAGASAASAFQRKATNHLTAAADGVTSTSTMIAVAPRPEEARAIAQPDGAAPETLHVTLAYLGDVEGDLTAVADALRPVAASCAPLAGIVGGIGIFAPSPEGLAPAIALPDVPGLVELRVAVTEALVSAGVDYSRLHGFCAHLTLAYFDPSGDRGGFEEPLPMLAPLHFDSLLLVRGDVVEAELPLVGVPPLTAAAPDPFLADLAAAMRKPIEDPDRPIDRLYFGPITAAGEPPQWSSPAGDEIVDVDRIVQTLRTKTDPVRQALVEASMTPTLKAAGLAFDATNPFTAKVLAQAGSHVTNIAHTTRANVMRTIRASYDQGLSIPDTAKAIQAGMRDAAPARARMIARTELAGAVNGGSLAATQIVSRVTGDTYYKQWLTAPGAQFPRHEEYDGLDGQTRPLDDAFDVGGAALDFPGDPGGEPGETINCFPAETLVEVPHLRAVTRRWYEGDLVRLRLASGDDLSGTPNHPVLAAAGRWKPLGEIEEGDYLVCAPLVRQKAGAPYPSRTPREIGQIYRLSDVLNDAHRVRLTPPDLHGDGTDGEVDVVAIGGNLLLDYEAARDEQVAEFGLALADRARSRARDRIYAGGTPRSLRDIKVGSSRLVSVSGQGSTALVAEPPHSDAIRLRPTPERDTEFVEATLDDASADPEITGEGENALASRVSLAEVVEVDRYPFRGFVFTLDTGEGWYTANTVVVRNCRCALVYTDKAPEDGGVEPTATSDGGDQGGVASAVESLAAGLLERAVSLEPATTAELSATAKAAGGRLGGLEFRLKTRPSLERKIKSDLEEARRLAPDATVEQVAGAINDSLRYTIELDPAKYAAGVRSSVDRLKEAGYELVKMKNYWGNEDYQGINAVFRAPGGGNFELQFHTPTTFELKTKLHLQYEGYRTSTDPVERRLLWDQMAAEQKRVAVPDGALGIGAPVRHTFAPTP